MTDPVSYQVRRNGPLNPEIIEFLDEQRIANRWSYKELGERLGVSSAFAHNLLNKSGNISTGTYMVRVAKGIERLRGGSGDDVEAAAPAFSAAMREHSYHLRDDLQVLLRLPSDLTEREAERLSLFIRSLAQ